MTRFPTQLTALLSALALTVCLSGSYATTTPVVAATTLDQLESQLKDLQAQEKEIKGDLAAVGAREGAAVQVLGLVVARKGGAGGTQPGFVAGISLPEQGDALTECRVRVRECHKLQSCFSLQVPFYVFCLNFDAAGVDDGIHPPQNAEVAIGGDFGCIVGYQLVDSQVGDADLQGAGGGE